MCVLYVSVGSKVRPSPSPLGALPCVVQCCIFLGRDSSYIPQMGLELFCLELV